ncbi:MAG: Pantothenate synthetase [Pseudomonadota bacterium]|jgi:pantoate--beta-alanine ligase
MHVFHHIKSLRQALQQARSEGKRIGFVPTMGNLHQAHLELVKIAQAQSDFVVASIFVNRLQFGLNEDWDRYPRTLDADCEKLRSVHCDVLFCPDETEMYPNGMDEQARVILPCMSDVLCGASRPGHFTGVTTVVTKLFNIVGPDIAVFGLKDYQQLAIIRRMTEDLCIPVRLVPGPIVREADGLAMSSRNSFITAAERPQVTVLYQSLSDMAAAIKRGERDFQQLELAARDRIEAAGFKVDYISVRDSKYLQPAACDDTSLTLLGAMYTQSARLIDNIALDF